MIHVCYGGYLDTCHFLDSHGVELIDPLVADVSPMTLMTSLQSTIRIALKTTFGDTNLDGPLLITDWCRGRVQLGEGGHIAEGYSGKNASNDSKEATSIVTAAIGEPITPPQCSAGSSINLKGTPLQQMDHQICEFQCNTKN